MRRWPCHQGLKICFTSRRPFSLPSSPAQTSGSSGMCRARSLPHHMYFQSVGISCSILRLSGAFCPSLDPHVVEFVNKDYGFSHYVVENETYIYLISSVLLSIFVATIILSEEKELVPTRPELSWSAIIWAYYLNIAPMKHSFESRSRSSGGIPLDPPEFRELPEFGEIEDGSVLAYQLLVDGARSADSHAAFH